jgi:hypothetical protein
MTGSAVVDTILGLVFVFYALALLCSGVVEMIANWVKKRAKYLLRGLHDLLMDTTTVTETAVQRVLGQQPFKNVGSELESYKSALVAHTDKTQVAPAGLTPDMVIGHPLVLPFKHTSSLGKATRNPAYLPAPVFRSVMADLLTWGPANVTASVTAAEIQQRLNGLPANQDQLKQALTSLLKTAGGDVETFLAATEEWFNQQMERVSGSYKRWAKRWVIVIATAVVLAGGFDSIAIARTLYANDAIRASIVQSASERKLCQPQDPADVCAKNAQAFFTASDLPIGWSEPSPADGKWGWPLKILGLLISIGAASLGAPFWYRVLDRVGSLRNTGRTPSTPT